MTPKQKRRQMQRRKKRMRRIKRRLKAYAARTVAVVTLLLIGILVFRGGAWLLKGLEKAEETFQGARIIEPAERKPGSKLIVVDAGHGGRDQGTSAGDILEKDINLLVAKKLAKKLEDAGALVIFTREDDTKIGLEERAAFANENKADLFISLHCNYCEDDAGVQGLECYYREDSEEGQALADRIVQSVQEEEKIGNRGTRTANFRVLRKTDMPAVLVEMGYLSNRSEREKMTDDAYQELLADRIAEGILSSESEKEESAAGKCSSSCMISSAVWIGAD